jgi:hypothetical protein
MNNRTFGPYLAVLSRILISLMSVSPAVGWEYRVLNGWTLATEGLPMQVSMELHYKWWPWGNGTEADPARDVRAMRAM